MSAVKGKRRGWHYCPTCQQRVYRMTQQRPGYDDPSKLFRSPPAMAIEIAPDARTKRFELGLAVWCKRGHPASFTVL